MWHYVAVNIPKDSDRLLVARARLTRWRNGIIAVVMLVLPWMILILVPSSHLDVGSTVAISIGLSTLWLTWALYREAVKANALSLPSVADSLAEAVRELWINEARVRSLNEPYPLPVSWVAAEKSLTVRWDGLLRTADSGVGWPSRSLGRSWAVGPEELAGKDNEFADVFSMVPTERMVVLGEPGAGKTSLMVRFILERIERRDPGDRVPILFSLSSWNISEEKDEHKNLLEWMADLLARDYAQVFRYSTRVEAQLSLAMRLLKNRLILPILDGLDEMPEKAQKIVIGKINKELPPGEPLVITCRTEEYREAVRSPQGGVVPLNTAAAVQLCPLDAAAVRLYLTEAAKEDVARERWEDFFNLLNPEGPVAQTLRRPLMLGLANAIYNRKPVVENGPVRDPVELLRTELGGQEAVNSFLMNEFIPAAYQSDFVSRWKIEDAEKWLKFLAWHSRISPGYSGMFLPLLRDAGSGPSIDLWKIAPYYEWSWRPLAVIHYWVRKIRPIFGPTAYGDVPFILRYERSRRPLAVIRHWVRKIRPIFGPTSYDDVPLISRLSLTRTAEKIAYVLFGALPTLLDYILDASSVASPVAAEARERRVAIIAGTVTGMGSGLLGGIASAAVVGEHAGIAFGAIIGVVIGVWGLLYTRWAQYELAKMRIAAHHRLPWRLMAFLADAHRRGILRQVGVFYEFRHIELQRQLAERYKKEDGRWTRASHLKQAHANLLAI